MITMCKQNMTVLTKSRCIIIFRRFTVCYNAHIILILLIQFSWFAIRRSTILLDWFPYSSISFIFVKLIFLCFINFLV